MDEQTKARDEQRRLDPFATLESIRTAYRQYVSTFQRFKNPVIRDWVDKKLDEGTVISKGPYIELNRRFAVGDAFDTFVDEGLLHPETPQCFTSDPHDKSSSVVELYRHQSDAVRKVLEGKNTIIATGTGSGKSFCFAIPIISECLRLRDEGVKGIKAVIVYPMNALANSQYDDFSARLAGTGLTIALYTGDTPNSRAEALKSYRQLTGRDEPYDCELISREEIKASPPDILLTNYVMLEYILTRFEDKTLFPEKDWGVLKFLVLDEVHTYTGKKGADVAYLVRRLKQHTNTIGKLRCVGTSATVQSGEEDAATAISSFASSLFGEQFEADSVINETYAEPPHEGEGILPEHVLITQGMLEGFDGTPEQVQTLIEALTGTPAGTDWGSILDSQKTIQFIEDNLFQKPMSLEELAHRYNQTVRPTSTRKECELELMAAFLAGMHTEITVHGKPQKRIVPKIHSFFSQGREIKSCITADGPHLNDAGEVICPICAKKGKDRLTFPLVFCRSCGQEYYSVEIMPDGTLKPREMDETEVEGDAAYIFVGRYDPEQTPLPEPWLTDNGKVKSTYREYAELQEVEYCPECNKVYKKDAEKCSCSGKLKVTIVPYKFLFCPSDGCGVFYERTFKEFSKLFSFGTVGRSTATDILVSNSLNTLPQNERKIIVFTDNRQDTAL
ncbi:MAG: DEAD/DEAH box helicase, partial [Methermicoccaceae archaeon]